MSSCYRILGVPRSATDAEIRAAYIRLIKQYHPDRAQNSENSASRDINHAYAILKDPKRRAEHDRSLEYARQVRVAVQPSAFQQPAGRWRGRASGVTLLCLSIGLIGVALKMAPSPSLEANAARSEKRLPSAEELLARHPPIDVDNVSGAVWDSAYLRSNEGAGRLVAHSRHCFEQLSFERTLDLYDYCVGFDHGTHVALAQRGQAIPYFTAGEIEVRHQRASDELFDPPDAADVRRSRLEKIATAQALGEAASGP